MRGDDAEIATAIGFGATEARIPRDADAPRPRRRWQALNRRRREVVDDEERLAGVSGLDARLLARHVGKGNAEIVAGLHIAPCRFGNVAILPTREGEIRQSRTHHRGALTAHDLDLQRELVERHREAQRQLVDRVATAVGGGHDQVGEVLERDGPASTRRDGEDAGAEVVAADPFDETRVDAAPHFGFKGDAGLPRLDDDAVRHPAVDVEREPRDQGAFGEGEHELAIEDAAEVVAKHQRRARARAESGDRHVIARLFEHQRRGWCGIVLTNEEHRRANLDRGRRREGGNVLGRRRRRAGPAGRRLAVAESDPARRS